MDKYTSDKYSLLGYLLRQTPLSNSNNEGNCPDLRPDFPEMNKLIQLAEILGYDKDILNSLSHEYFHVNDFRKMNEAQIETMVQDLTERAKSRKLIVGISQELA